MSKNRATKIVVEKPARRNGMVVAMLNRQGDGKHRNRADKRTAQKERRFMEAAY